MQKCHTHVPFTSNKICRSNTCSVLPPGAQLGSQQELLHIMHNGYLMQRLQMSKRAQQNTQTCITPPAAKTHGSSSNCSSDKHTTAQADWTWQLLCVMLAVMLLLTLLLLQEEHVITSLRGLGPVHQVTGWPTTGCLSSLVRYLHRKPRSKSWTWS